MSHAALRVDAGDHTLQDLLDNRPKITRNYRDMFKIK
jgi:hypothetical protein